MSPSLDAPAVPGLSLRTAPALILDAPELSVRLCTGASAWVLQIVGELDIQITAITDWILVSAGTAVIVVDMWGVTFMDARGLALLAACHRVTAAAGGAVRLVSPSRQVRRILEITEMDRAVTVFDTLDHALAVPAGGARGHRS